MTTADRINLRTARRIQKLEADIKLANARIHALEARPTVITMSLIPTPPTVTPPTPWPNYPLPGTGDYPFNPNTCSGSVTSAKTDGLQVRQ